MFRPFLQVAPPGSKSTVSDCVRSKQVVAAVGAVLHGRQPALREAGDGHPVAGQPHQSLPRLRQRQARPRVTGRHPRSPLRRPPRPRVRPGSPPSGHAAALRRDIGEHRRADWEHPGSEGGRQGSVHVDDDGSERHGVREVATRLRTSDDSRTTIDAPVSGELFISIVDFSAEQVSVCVQSFDQSINQSIDWLIYLFIDLLIGSFIHWFIGWFIDWLCTLLCMCK